MKSETVVLLIIAIWVIAMVTAYGVNWSRVRRLSNDLRESNEARDFLESQLTNASIMQRRSMVVLEAQGAVIDSLREEKRVLADFAIASGLDIGVDCTPTNRIDAAPADLRVLRVSNREAVGLSAAIIAWDDQHIDNERIETVVLMTSIEWDSLVDKVRALPA